MCAEEVRAYFVEVRGGAPFLSSADGRALLGWLEAGVPVARILVAVDRTAERRRARRTRAPFRLRDIRRDLGRTDGGGAPPRGPPSPAAEPGEGDDGLEPLFREALARVGALPEGDPDARARAACTIGREFFHAAWARLGDRREALLAQAADELSDLREGLGETAFRAACEELARDQVRRRFPELTASRLCEELGLGLG